jgi:two-component system CheB/CheR fusion protein
MSFEEKDPAFEKLLEYLKNSRSFDFTEYKRASLMRRVNKRMNEVGIDEYEEYQDYLEVHPQEFTELFNTVLINVTSFYRDPEAWDYLAKEIMPHILEAKTPTSTVRLWSAGCASGEEAYSLAILLAEALGVETSRRQVKIYATDVDEDDLERARRGIYNEKAIEGLPEDLLKRYFNATDNNGNYVFRQDLRRTLVFGRHDLMQDAPISRLDLLVCRNTLIYFNREAQERIIGRFHFALKDSGYLFLGRAETMLTHNDMFKPADMKHRIFRKVFMENLRGQAESLTQAGDDVKFEMENAGLQVQLAAFDAAFPAQVVIDQQGNLVQANEEARLSLGLDRRDLGSPFRDLELSYRPLDLRSIIDQSREEKRSIQVRDVERALPQKNGQEYVDVIVIPLWGKNGGWLGTSISFIDATERQKLKTELEQAQHDLETSNEELQSTNEELETSNEELQSTVEELQTTNEELQSTNEEMETMNEELQSSNAELQSMNEQLRDRTLELNRLNAFLESILASVDVAVVVIDRDFVVSLWNERAEDLWGLRSEEVEGHSLLELDIGLPVVNLKEPVDRFLSGEADDGKIELDAINRRGKSIKCYVTRTVRLDEEGEPEGVVLLMEEAQK